MSPGGGGAVTKKNKKFREELIAYFPLIRHGPHRKRHLQQFLVAAGTCLSSRCLATIGGYTDRLTGSPLIRHGPHRKWHLQQFVVAAGTCLPSHCLASMGGYSDPQTVLWYDTDRIENCLQQFLVAAGTCSPSPCLATIGGYADRPTLSPLIRHGPHRKRRVHSFYCCMCIRCRGNIFTEPLPSNIHIQTDWWGDLWSTPLSWTPVPWCIHVHTKFHKDWFRHSEVNKGDTQTHRQEGDRIHIL
jgi:hypothetical protein